MSRISINSNIASLNTQRRFEKSSSALQESFSRLSSGLRINRAVDDASGLAISTALRTDSRVFVQGVRNINDAVSLLNIAEGAASELSSILIRTRELATQSANGTLSYAQRKALDQEGKALVEEYNRILNSTDFNNQQLIDGNLEELRVQAGYGEDGSITFGLGDGLARTVGDGSFGAGTDFDVTADEARQVALEDLNGDGNLDLAVSTWSGVNILMGNGDGSFKGEDVYAPGAVNARGLVIGDVNLDGVADIVHSSYAAAGQGSIGVMIGNGDGSFRAGVSYVTPDPRGEHDIVLTDLNGDNTLDVILTAETGPNILLGNSDGSFRQGTVAFGATALTRTVHTADVNSDGNMDILAGEDDGVFTVHIGRGDGTFSTGVSYVADPTSGDAYAVKSGDFDGDGILDVVATGYDGGGFLSISIGNGDGTFKAATSYVSDGGALRMEVEDFDQDGNLDLAVADWASPDRINLYLGNGDGSFKGRTSSAVSSPEGLTVGDVNNDGAIDLVTGNWTNDSVTILLANTQEVNTLTTFDLSTRQGALDSIEQIDAALIRVNEELAGIGAAQSRFSTAVANLQVASENYEAASSQIRDVDVAEEAANLVRNQILQQAAASVLSQANQTPSLALRLLQG